MCSRLVVHLCYRNIQENLQQNGRTYITQSKRIKYKAVKNKSDNRICNLSKKNKNQAD